MTPDNYSGPYRDGTPPPDPKGQETTEEAIPTERAVLIDCCEKVRKFRGFTPAEDEKFKTIIREALEAARAAGFAAGVQAERARCVKLAEECDDRHGARHAGHGCHQGACIAAAIKRGEP